MHRSKTTAARKTHLPLRLPVDQHPPILQLRSQLQHKRPIQELQHRLEFLRVSFRASMPWCKQRYGSLRFVAVAVCTHTHTHAHKRTPTHTIFCACFMFMPGLTAGALQMLILAVVFLLSYVMQNSSLNLTTCAPLLLCCAPNMFNFLCALPPAMPVCVPCRYRFFLQAALTSHVLRLVATVGYPKLWPFNWPELQQWIVRISSVAPTDQCCRSSVSSCRLISAVQQRYCATSDMHATVESTCLNNHSHVLRRVATDISYLACCMCKSATQKRSLYR